MNHKLPSTARNILAKMSSELSEDLYYHCAQHTVDVIDECILFADEDSLDHKQAELLLVAAAYHDAGFLFRYDENEELGANLALQELAHNYSTKELEEIKKCILSTKLNSDLTRTPLSELSKYLLDADLSSLGRDDLFEKTELLAKETKQNLNDLYHKTYALMLAHHWLTPAAKKLRQAGKEKNLKKIKEMLK